MARHTACLVSAIAAAHARSLAGGFGVSLTLARAEHLHVKPGKGAAFVRTKLKNQVTGTLLLARGRARPRGAVALPGGPPTYLKSARRACAGNTVEKTFRAGEKVRPRRLCSCGAALTVFPGGCGGHEQVREPVHLR